MHFRDRDFTPRTGRRRVIVVGDSFTEGQGVREKDVLPRVLERVLNDADPGRWEVLNVGRRGADFPALNGTFGQALGLQPDVVIYAMMLNDPEVTDSFRERHAFVYDRLARGWHRRGEAPSLFRLASFVSSRVDAARVERETTRWYRELYGRENRQGWQRTQEHLADMDRRAADRGIHFVVAVWPVLAGLEDAYPFEAAHLAIARVCERLQIPRHDLLPVLRGRRSSSLWVHHTDRHPNEAAHALAARSLAPVVRSYWAGS
jgi:lysophospholipase L1-like esterase